jgi:hypothetical protein
MVLGTSLAVCRSDGETLVEVRHGAVAVMRGAGGMDGVRVASGQRVLATPSLPLTLAAIGSPCGSTYPVGDGQAYADLAALPALKPGDVVEIHAGTHRGARSLRASGTALRPIVIRGVGAEPPLIDGDGVDVGGVGETPRALFQIQGDHYLIEHLAFANARNGENGAAIRCLGARHVVIRGCRIARCDDGIMAGDDVDDLRIEDCDIGWTGTAQRDGYCHGIYIGGDRAVVRGCSIHDAQYGQAFKSSCRTLELIANRIVGADDGEISFIDGPGTEAATSSLTLSGNLVASKADRRGNTRRFIEVGTENGGIRGGTLTLRGNTFVAADPRVIFVDTVHSAMRVVADETIFVGSDHIATLGAGGISGRRDWLPTTAEVPAGLVDLLRGDQPGFVDAAHGDFHLAPTSPCLGLGAFSQQP